MPSGGTACSWGVLPSTHGILCRVAVDVPATAVCKPIPAWTLARSPLKGTSTENIRWIIGSPGRQRGLHEGVPVILPGGVQHESEAAIPPFMLAIARSGDEHLHNSIRASDANPGSLRGRPRSRRAGSERDARDREHRPPTRQPGLRRGMRGTSSPNLPPVNRRTDHSANHAPAEMPPVGGRMSCMVPCRATHGRSRSLERHRHVGKPANLVRAGQPHTRGHAASREQRSRRHDRRRGERRRATVRGAL